MSGRLASSSDGLLRTHSARKIAKALQHAGYEAKIADHEYAVKISDADGQQICILWLPIGEPTPTGLGHVYLWGKTGDEHQAPDFTGVNDLVKLVVATLPPVAA